MRPRDRRDDLDESYDELAAVAELVETNFGHPQFHRTLYNTLKHNVLPTVGKEASPPLPLIVYGIRNILEPFFVHQEIPNLLRLIVQLECVRNSVVASIQLLLRQCGHVLDPDSRQSLEVLTRPQRLSAQRTVYRKIIDGSSLLYMHHLWRVFDPSVDPPLTTYLVNYFPCFFLQRDPSFAEDCRDALRAYPWHYEMSEEERADNAKTGERAVEFVVSAAEHLANPDQYCSDRGYDADTPFDDMFPPPDSDQIVKAIMRFVAMVNKAADTLEQVLSASAPRTSR